MMEILEYYALGDAEQRYWRGEIGKSDWRAGTFLCSHLEDGSLTAFSGGEVRLLLGVSGRELMAFCTLARQDIPDPTLKPWIGFVYTFPRYRGRRLSQRMIDHACGLAKRDGAEYVYLSTNEIGLYEKYGFAFFKQAKDAWGEETSVYRREL